MNSPRIKAVFLSISVLIVLLLVLSLSWFGYKHALTPVSPSSTSPISFAIDSNETAISILSRLENQQLIRSALAARIYLKTLNLEKRLSPGIYYLNRSLSTNQIVQILTHGPEDIRITIPEGWRREQIAARLSSSLSGYSNNFNTQEFIDQTATLEGQLFPDTYLVPAQSTTQDIIKMLVNNFQKKTNLSLSSANQVESGLTPKDILILSSLVEREAKTDSDRLVIAGILKKRLSAHMPLQIDATVQYATDSLKCAANPTGCDWWKPITNTKLPSNYNTYLNQGLPPQPICNPGLASIEAVQHAQDSPYWYYLTDDSGVTHYAVSLNDHNSNIDKYLRP